MAGEDQGPFKPKATTYRGLSGAVPAVTRPRDQTKPYMGIYSRCDGFRRRPTGG